MRELTPENVADYLRDTGRVPPGRRVAARAMGWGVSNVVLRVDVEGTPPFVLKQARERLRTEKLWVSRLERVWTERDAMGLLGGLLPEGTVPRVLFSDEQNYLFAMTHAPEGASVWKEQLLAGAGDPAVARRAGEILGTIHRETRGHPALNGRLADTTVFDELRVDPFYREIARVHPEIAPAIDALIASMSEAPGRCLVLGDFSPKNLLVHDAGLTLVDFETAHAGDPAFDVGFFLSHLFLKTLRHALARPGGRPSGVEFVQPVEFDGFSGLRLGDEFLDAYLATAGPAACPPASWPPFAEDAEPPFSRHVRHGDTRTTLHLCACVLARVDGKSPVDYLDAAGRSIAREAALGALRRAAGGTGNAK
jgi:5-methylthioribose kinase